ncbi:pre-mRNA-splicing factor 8 [Ceratobasidium sp. 394]|nr:pre-mRNA-splicing factor 8 [Ceratobasidium sp. 394]
MRHGKRDRQHKHVCFLPFGDEEPPPGYAGDVLGGEPFEAMRIDHSEEDNPVLERFYDPRPLVGTPTVIGEPCALRLLDLPAMANLYAPSSLTTPIPTPLIHSTTDPLYSTALNMAIPGGPKFKPLYPDKDVFDEDLNEISVIIEVITRQQIRTERKATFSRLYHSLPRSIHIAPYHNPKNVYIRTEDPDLPAFSFDHLVNPVSFRAGVPHNTRMSHGGGLSGLNDDNWELPEDVEPFLHEPLECDQTADARALCRASAPNKRVWIIVALPRSFTHSSLLSTLRAL